MSSPSTTAIDKLDEYPALPSVSAIVLVEPDLVSVKVYRRTREGWETERYGTLGDRIDFSDVGAVLSLAELYDTLDPANPAQVPSL